MKYFQIFLIQCTDVFQQRARSFVFFLLALMLPLVTLFFWQGAFKTQKTIGGWTASEMRSYYLLTIVAGNFLIVHLERWGAYHEIKEGDISAKLLQPIGYLWLMFAYETPWRLIQGLFGIAIFLVFLLFGFGITITSQISLLALAGVVWFSALLLCYFLKMCIAILAFWLTDINALLETQDVLLLVFTGIIMPIDLLPWNLLSFGQMLPFPYIIYYPVLAVIGKLSAPELIRIILIQWVWIMLLYLLFKVLWKRGVYKYSGVGQ